MSVRKRILGLVTAIAALGPAETLGQGQSGPSDLEACIGRLERAASTLQAETAAMRQRLARACPARVAAPEPLVQSLQAAMRTKLVGSPRGGQDCAQLDVAFDGMSVRVRGAAPNRDALEKAAAEIRSFIPGLAIDLKEVDSLGCRKPLPGTDRTVLLDEAGELRRLTFDQAQSLGPVFPMAEECESIGPSVAPSLSSGTSNRRFWVWSAEFGHPVYCIEAGGTWILRESQLHDGRGAGVLKLR